MRTLFERKRGCGYRDKGAVYLVSELDPNGVLPPYVLIDPPILYDGKHFRGWVEIDLGALLSGVPFDDCLTGASGERANRLQADAWDVSQYGMPFHERQGMGICAEATNGTDVIAILRGLEFQLGIRRIYAEARKLAQVPRVAAGVSQILAGCRARMPRDVLAGCWRIARDVDWHQRKKVRQHLVFLMACVGAQADAMELVKRWSKK